MSDIENSEFYLAIESLWQRICERFDKKLDSVTNQDDSIEVLSNRKVKVKVSKEDGNRLTLKRTGSKGLYVPKIHKLTFGAGEQYTFDGSADVTVPVYTGHVEP